LQLVSRTKKVDLPVETLETASVQDINGPMLSKTKTDWASEMASDQVFHLIDTVLPFEACLYYQVLPLSLEGSIFKLGIVDPQDDLALDYVRRILAYMNCSVVTQPISSEAQRSMLSAYLFHSSQPQEITGISPEVTPVKKAEKAEKADETATDDPTIIQAIVNSSPPPTKINEISQPQTETTAIAQPPIAKTAKSEVLESSTLDVLDVQALYLASPVEVLATLPPQQLLPELLARVLEGGIGRLFFERQESHGKILWSQDGVLKSVLEGLNGNIFQGVIDELKRLTQLPLTPLEAPKQVEIERVYQQTHLLLRLRIMPGNYGEEATLQVLRGAALRFFQQQQLSNLNRDALRLAEQLQRKVNEIRDRTRLAPMPMDISALEKLLKSVDEQLEALIAEHKLQNPDS
jgi:type II secretory ATPase GspE/PulE/Tfp pilus assembly ATPase PilB-like protein